MKLQLTKDKTIEVKMPGGGRTLSDVTGVALNSGDARGCPAVRIVRRKNVWTVAAAGFVPAPAGGMPDSWEALGRRAAAWSLPGEFQAPHAALAVVSRDGFLRQVSPDALMSDLGGDGKGTDPAAGAAPKKKLGIRREERKPVENTAAEKNPAKAAVTPGVPVSANGVRFVTAALEEEAFVLQAGLPEYQTLWAARLLPEGKRPTACSIQVEAAALLASMRAQPAFAAAGGTAFVVFVMRQAVYLAAFRAGALLLFRPCPGVAGWEMLREGVKLRLGLEEEMVDEILDDALVDPCAAMEPVVRPVLRQVEISLDYVAGRYGLRIDKVFVMGLPSGARYWSQMSRETLGLELLAPGAFEGYALAPKNKTLRALTPSATQAYLAALGAARAALEEGQ